MRSASKKEAFRGMAVMAALVLILASCNRSSPTEPKLVVSTSWSVTRTVTSVSDTDVCMYAPVPGQSEQGAFELQRSGDSVSFLFPFDINGDLVDYTGTVTGTAFTARHPEERYGPGSSCVSYRSTYTLSGRFSEDGSHLAASEVWTWTLDSGQVKTFTFEWSASRG